MEVRTYNPETDSPGIETLLKDEKTYGGNFDPARDATDRLAKNPDSVFVAVTDGRIVGTVTAFENGRIAWLFRFGVLEEYEDTAAPLLFDTAAAELKKLGHSQVEVYAPVGVEKFIGRYQDLGFEKGNNYTAFWQDI